MSIINDATMDSGDVLETPSGNHGTADSPFITFRATMESLAVGMDVAPLSSASKLPFVAEAEAEKQDSDTSFVCSGGSGELTAQEACIIGYCLLAASRLPYFSWRILARG